MDKKSILLTIVFVLAVLVSVFAIYYRYIVLKDISYETDEEAFQAALLEE